MDAPVVFPAVRPRARRVGHTDVCLAAFFREGVVLLDAPQGAFVWLSPGVWLECRCGHFRPPAFVLVPPVPLHRAGSV